MPSKLSFSNYLSRIPEQYRNSVNIVDKFSGKRTEISFKHKVCGCTCFQELGVFCKKSSFDVCKECKKKPEFSKRQKQLYCKRCNDRVASKNIELHETECKEKYSKLIEGKDYVVCTICNLHCKSLGLHLTTTHNVDLEEYKKNNHIICSKSSATYSKQNKISGDWIKRAKESGQDLSEYKQRMGEAVRDAILSNPEDRARRAKVMTEVNKTDVMRKKASETAIKTSARKDIQEKRATQLKKWRDKNPNDFYNKCVFKMITTFQSKPEKILFNIVSELDGFDFKRNQFISSKDFNTKTKKKQIDILDREQKIFIEFDGILHFKNVFKNIDRFKKIQYNDAMLDKLVIDKGWLLIRISYDQFISRNNIRNCYFKQECLEQLFEILEHQQPGVYKIGKMYKTENN